MPETPGRDRSHLRAVPDLPAKATETAQHTGAEDFDTTPEPEVVSVDPGYEPTDVSAPAEAARDTLDEDRPATEWTNEEIAAKRQAARNGRSKGKTSPHAILKKERIRRAVQMRLGGATGQQIADELGYASAANALRAVHNAMDKRVAEPTDVARQVHRERLDMLLVTQWNAAMNGDEKAFDNVLKVLDRKAKFEGLDAPSKVEIDAHTTHTEARVLRIEADSAPAGASFLEAMQAAAGWTPPALSPSSEPGSQAGPIVVDADVVEES